VDIAPSDNLRLHIVRDAIRRRWPVLVIVVLIVTVPLAALLTSRPVKHTASAAVLLRPIPGNALNQSQTASSQQITIAMETEAQLVTSPNVVNQVNDKLDTDLKPGTRSVGVTIPPNTEIIRIAYTAKTADEAMAGAQAFADQFMAFRTEEATRSQGRQLRNLNQQLRDARAAFRSASEDASGADPSASAEANLPLGRARRQSRRKHRHARGDRRRRRQRGVPGVVATDVCDDQSHPGARRCRRVRARRGTGAHRLARAS